MEDFRSKSYSDGRYEMERYNDDGFQDSNSKPNGFQDLRCYSASYASSSSSWNKNNAQIDVPKEIKFKKGKSSNGSISKSWSLNDPELQRKKRVASYKVYAVEGKVKGSIKKSFRWLKEKCTRVVYSWR